MSTLSEENEKLLRENLEIDSHQTAAIVKLHARVERLESGAGLEAKLEKVFARLEECEETIAGVIDSVEMHDDSAERYSKAWEMLDARSKKNVALIEDLATRLNEEKEARLMERTVLQDHISRIEKLINDKSDEHQRAMEESVLKMQSGALSSELMLGERHSTLKTVSDSINQKVDAIKANVKQVSTNLQDLETRVSQESSARTSLNSALKVRIECMEKLVGQSAETRHAKVEQRLQDLQTQIIESQERSSTSVDSLMQKLKDYQAQIAKEKPLQEKKYVGIDERIRTLEQDLACSNDSHKSEVHELQGSLRSVLSNIEEMTFSTRGEIDALARRVETLDQSHERHWEQMHSARSKLQEVSGHIVKERATHEDHWASIEERLQFIEAQLGDSAGKHEKHTQELKAATAKLNGIQSTAKSASEEHHKHRATTEERLEFLERTVGDSAARHEKHWQDFNSVRSKLDVVHGAVSEELKVREQHTISLEERVAFVETQLGDSATAQKQHTQEFTSAVQR